MFELLSRVLKSKMFLIPSWNLELLATREHNFHEKLKAKLDTPSFASSRYYPELL